MKQIAVAVIASAFAAPSLIPAGAGAQPMILWGAAAGYGIPSRRAFDRSWLTGVLLLLSAAIVILVAFLAARRWGLLE